MKEFQSTTPLSEEPRRTPFFPYEEQKVGSFYGISPVKKRVRNLRGLVNFTYELDDRYFLTIYQGWTAKELEVVSEIANGLSDSIPLVRPVQGQTGYATELKSGPALLCPRLEGIHFVNNLHTEKQPIPIELHRSLAKFFWEFQKGLSAAPDHLKTQLTRPSRVTIGQIPESFPDLAEPLEKYAPEDEAPEFMYPDLIHDDLERQNILSIGDKITGIVDLDSVRSGDILYEFGHFLFNNVFCDPNADNATAAVYIEELMRTEIVNPQDISAIYSYIYQFAISDIADFQDLIQNPKTNQNISIDLELLVRQYDIALSLAHEFFNV